MTPSPSETAPWVGVLLEGRYRVAEVLGAGGMGTVYRADDLRMSRSVVIKVPHERHLAEEGFRARFEKEIQSLVALDHPGVVKVHDAGEHAGVPYAVLQFLAGGSLKDRLRGRSAGLAPAEVAGWLPAVAAALDAIHRERVIHRDIKPANVLFDRAGHVFLADFGIAKALGSPDTGLTQTGATPGSPDYMAPEVSLGASIGPAYDQYALAVTVYQALSGRLPHDPTGSPARILYQKASEPPRSLAEVAPHVPPALAAVVLRALSRDADARFPSCVAFANAFVTALHAPVADGEAATALPTRVPPPPPSHRPRYGLRRAVGALVGVGLLAGVLAAAGVFSDSGKKVPGTVSPSDTTPPTLTVAPAGPEIEVGPSGRVTMRGQAMDEHLEEVLADNDVISGVRADGAFDYEVVLAEGGTRTVVFQARDEAGNVSAVVVRTLKRAAAPPTTPAPEPEAAWKAPLLAATTAGTGERWEEAMARYDEAVALNVPFGEIPEWLRAGVEAWRSDLVGTGGGGGGLSRDAAKRKVSLAREIDLGGGEALRFVWIPPGTFTMGSPPSEEGRDNDEVQHEVELTKGYYLSIHEVTNGQYRRFKPGHDSGKDFNDATQPVVLVSHDDATAFVGWLSGRGGSDRYRLPTESEWEYACRAGTTTPFHFGTTISPSQANYDGDFAYANGLKGEYRQQTTPVGTFASNAWGLYDMHGNVYEWCSDWSGTHPTGRVRDPQGASSGSARVLRGGSWVNSPRRVRSAYRSSVTPDFRNDVISFRVVLVAPP